MKHVLCSLALLISAYAMGAEPVVFENKTLLQVSRIVSTTDGDGDVLAIQATNGTETWTFYADTDDTPRVLSLREGDWIRCGMTVSDGKFWVSTVTIYDGAGQEVALEDDADDVVVTRIDRARDVIIIRTSDPRVTYYATTRTCPWHSSIHIGDRVRFCFSRTDGKRWVRHARHYHNRREVRFASTLFAPVTVTRVEQRGNMYIIYTDRDGLVYYADPRVCDVSRIRRGDCVHFHGQHHDGQRWARSYTVVTRQERATIGGLVDNLLRDVFKKKDRKHRRR